MLQADSEDMLNLWFNALQSGIRTAIQRGLSTLAISDSNDNALPVTKMAQANSSRTNVIRKTK